MKFRTACIALTLLALAACGGGGGGGSSPTPAPTPATFTIGGTVTGLTAGTSLVLQNNAGSNLTVSANGPFTFGTAVNSGGAYAVTVLTQPTGQTCTLTSATGTATANVTAVAVACAATPATSRTIGGNLTGLAAGTSVVLQNNGGSNLTVSANGAFTFATPVNNGAGYAVTVLTQPTGQTCTVTGGTGTANANVTSVAVACAATTSASYTIGGTISGLGTGSTVVLRNNGGNDLSVGSNGAFTFSTALASGVGYAVTVLTQPTAPGPGQTCTVSNGTGTVAGANVATVTLTCVNTDVTAPTVVARSPRSTSIGSRVQGPVLTVTFSEAMNPATISTSSLTLQGPGGTPVAGAVTLSAGNTQATFTPTSPLAFDAEYTATLTTAVRDPSGNALAATLAWRFNTGKQLAIGYFHACSRTVDGRVKCWGDNAVGQLGYDDTVARGASAGQPTSALAAVNLGTGRTAVALVAGDYHNCAILDDGNAKCWGDNFHGELGQEASHGAIGEGAGDMAALPAINFGAGRTVLEIAAGQGFTCARLDNAQVKCWGANDSGQLGQGNTSPLGVALGDIAAAVPIPFAAGFTPVSLSLGHYHTCALLADANDAKRMVCWGRNDWGQLGYGNTNILGDQPGEMAALTAIAFPAGLTPQFMMATGGHTCAILSDLSTRCWGLNTWGQVGLATGNGTPPNPLLCSNSPLDCIGDQPGEMGSALTAAIAAGQTARMTVGFRHGCALRVGGQVVCWGSNEEGQVGIEDNTGAKVRIGDQAAEMAALVPVILKAGTSVSELSGGGFFTCVRNGVDESINCWGANDHGQLGINDIAGAKVNIGDQAGEMGTALVNLNLGP